MVDLLEMLRKMAAGDAALTRGAMGAAVTEIVRLRTDIAHAREAVGAGWLAGGVSLADAIRMKTRALERLFNGNFESARKRLYEQACQFERERDEARAKLAEVERELSDYKADAASAEEALREQLGKERAKARAQRAELHNLNKLRRGEVEAAIALRSELERARRVVEAVTETVNDLDNDNAAGRSFVLSSIVYRLQKALASAAPAADRTESARVEAALTATTEPTAREDDHG
jgi:chromosome segregation ATPase